MEGGSGPWALVYVRADQTITCHASQSQYTLMQPPTNRWPPSSPLKPSGSPTYTCAHCPPSLPPPNVSHQTQTTPTTRLSPNSPYWYNQPQPTGRPLLPHGGQAPDRHGERHHRPPLCPLSLDQPPRLPAHQHGACLESTLGTCIHFESSTHKCRASRVFQSI